MKRATDESGGLLLEQARQEEESALMAAGTRVDIARAFLEELFGATTPGLIEIRVRTASAQWRSYWFRHAKAAAKRAVTCDEEGADVYFGVGLRQDRDPSARSVHALGCAWVDIDPSGNCDLVEERIAILNRLRAFVPTPSIIISSGHGAHVYWLLEEKASPERVRAINLALARTLYADARACDPARVLRIPGTYNRKREPVPVLPWSGWQPGQRARRYRIDELPVVEVAPLLTAAHTSHGDDDAHPEVIEKVLKHGRDAKRQPNGKVSFCCPFHGDQHASAVVFPRGNFHCSACGVSEPASTWTQRPEVASWEVAGVIRPRRTERLLPPGCFKAPRIAITAVGPLLIPRRTVVALPHRPDLTVRFLDPSGTDVPFDELEQLDQFVMEMCGTLAFRVFWGSIVLAQLEHACTPTQGEFRFDPRRVGDLLGFARVGDGRHHGKTRTRIRKAIEGLTRIHVRFRWSTGTHWFEGPIVARLGGFAAGGEVYGLHPGIWRQMIGSSPAWMAWDPMALRLSEDGLALYLHARWEHQVKAARRGDVPLRFDLAQMATDAGVWRPERYAKDRGRYLDEWQRKLGAAGELGLSLELGRGSAVLVVSPLSQGSLEIHRVALPQEGVALPQEALLPSLPDHLTGGAKSDLIPMACDDDFRVECTNFRVECTRAETSFVSEHTKGGSHEG